MRNGRPLVLAAVILICLPWAHAQAGVRIGVGIGLPFPCFGYYGYGPYYGYPYAYPYPVYAAPVVYPAPVVAQPACPAPVAAPARLTASTPVTAQASPQGATIPVSARLEDVDTALQQLAGGDDRNRAEAAVQLGRLHALRAVDSLIRTLEQDRSPTVREAAARGLGLIAAPSSLTALQNAAQADDDREVRHSAGFAAEVIRGNLPR
jgi:hypothetical protein